MNKIKYEGDIKYWFSWWCFYLHHISSKCLQTFLLCSAAVFWGLWAKSQDCSVNSPFPLVPSSLISLSSLFAKASSGCIISCLGKRSWHFRLIKGQVKRVQSWTCFFLKKPKVNNIFCGIKVYSKKILQASWTIRFSLINWQPWEILLHTWLLIMQMWPSPSKEVRKLPTNWLLCHGDE